MDRFEHIPLLETDRIQRLIGKGNSKGADFARELLDMFEERSSEIMEKLTVLDLEKQRTEIQRYAHSIKGISLTMGAKRMAECCKLLENAVSEGGKEEYRQQIRVLAEIRDKTIMALKGLLNQQ